MSDPILHSAHNYGDPSHTKPLKKWSKSREDHQSLFLNLTCNSLDYKNRLHLAFCHFNMNCLELQDVIFAVRCLKDLDNFNITKFISFSTSNTRLSSNHKLIHKGHHRTNTSRHFYFKRLVKLWNALPVNVIDLSQPLSRIKNQLYKHFWDTFLTL